MNAYKFTTIIVIVLIILLSFLSVYSILVAMPQDNAVEEYCENDFLFCEWDGNGYKVGENDTHKCRFKYQDEMINEECVLKGVIVE